MATDKKAPEKKALEKLAIKNGNRKKRARQNTTCNFKKKNGRGNTEIYLSTYLTTGDEAPN